MLDRLKLRLTSPFDSAAIRAAIESAELLTSAEIRVSVSPNFRGPLEPVAWTAFDRLGMRATRGRNGVLFFVVPSRREFIVLGDEGIHAKVGQEFWDRVAAIVSERFRAGDLNGGLILGIAEVGRALAEFFPRDPATDPNELSDAVDFND